ncbi:MAG: YodL domain-containing protein [Anaerotignaceae bacterium]
MESIKLKNSLIYYYGSPCGYVKEGKAIIDRQFLCQTITQWCKKLKYEADFVEGVFDVLVEKEDASQFHKNMESFKNIRIWQLKANSDISMRFISFEDFVKQFGQPEKHLYEVVFDGNLKTNNLDNIYDICNFNHPQNYQGHSLSMSDVVELYDQEGSTFYYVDRFGFKEVMF